MQKLRILVLLAATMFMLSGCENSVNPGNAGGNPSTPTETEEAAQEEATQEDSEQEEDRPVFELSKEETAVYENYVKTLDKESFKDIDPVSIAKIFIQCGVDGQWEAEYGMYSEDGLTISKADYHAAHEEDIKTLDISTRKDMANIVFPNLKDSSFVDDGNSRGHIDFEAFDGRPWTFRLIKNQAGIWEVKYNPFDEFTD